MNVIEVISNEAKTDSSVASVDMKLEVVIIPVSDVDRAKEFYSTLGWRLDADRVVVEFRNCDHCRGSSLEPRSIRLKNTSAHASGRFCALRDV